MTNRLLAILERLVLSLSRSHVAAGVAIVALVISPAVFWLVAPHIFALQGQRRPAVISTTLGFVPIAYSLGRAKTGVDDWSWYSAQFLDYPNHHLSDIFGDTFHPENQIEEPLYYAMAWTLAQVFPGQVEWLIFLICFLVYATICGGVLVASRAVNLSAFRAVGLSYAMVGVAVVATLNLILVRQQLAIVMIFLAWAFSTNNSRMKSTLALVFAIGFHTSAVVPAIFLLMANFFGRRVRMMAISLAIPVGLFLGFSYFFLLGRDYSDRSDGQVSLVVILFTILVMLLQTNFELRGKLPTTPLNSDLLMVLLMLGFVVGTGNAAIPALRFFFYAWVFLVLVVWRMLDRVIPVRHEAGLAGVWALVGFAGVQARVWANPEGYASDTFLIAILTGLAQ